MTYATTTVFNFAEGFSSRKDSFSEKHMYNEQARIIVPSSDHACSLLGLASEDADSVLSASSIVESRSCVK